MQTNTMTEVQVLGSVKEVGICYANLLQFLEQGLEVEANLMMVYGAYTFLDLLYGNRLNVALKIYPHRLMDNKPT